MKFVRISEEFELSEFELSEFELPGVNYYKMYYQIQEKLDLVRLSGEFELSEFELAGFYCITEAARSLGTTYDSLKRPVIESAKLKHRRTLAVR